MISNSNTTLTYWLSEHPSIVRFRWSEYHSLASTWSFLFASIVAYVALSVSFHVLLSLLLLRRRRNRGFSLGPLPALHSLAVALSSAAIFVGISLSAAAEIRETRWIWRRSKTPFQWLLCFPLGTRSSGRVFFWSYAFYLSRFLHMGGTLITIIRRRKLSFFHLFNHSTLLFNSFLWLEYSQSFQVLAILGATSVDSVVYGYRFWTGLGFREACYPVVSSCRFVVLGCNLLCHVGVLAVHFITKGGCNGIGAWVFNSVLNGAILFLFLTSYVQRKKVHSSDSSKDEDPRDKYH